MTLALMLLGSISLVELLLYVSPFWHVRRVLAAGTMVAVAGVSGLVFADRACLASGLIILVSLYRMFNLLRLVEERRPAEYLRRAALRSSSWLIGWQLIILAVWGLGGVTHPNRGLGWLLLALSQLLIATVVLVTLQSRLKATRPQITSSHLADHELPSITVCIPARNETAALEDCLQSLVACDYPKLEVLVLDDCSQDRTPDIIKSFAHAGIRFIKGVEPPESWLAKNWAYQRLSEEANGELLVFSGVDVRFGSGSLRALITAMLATEQQMTCLLPRNTLSPHQSTLLQPLRYFGELGLPRRILHHPPVLSSCWVIKRDFLHTAGGFAALATAITPEEHFAKLAAQQSAYSFWQANGPIEVTSNKGLRDQWETAVRTRYPQLHRRPELVGTLSFVQLTGLVLPFILLVGSVWASTWPVTITSALTCSVLGVSYATIVRLTYRKFLLRGLFVLPVAVLADICIRHYSMWRYEFSEVLWKGRNVCLPVMRIIPHLPNL